MPELTVDMHQAISEALTRARNFLIAKFPDEGEHVFFVMLAGGFADLLRHPDEVTQKALADAANNRLAATPWQIIRRRAD